MKAFIEKIESPQSVRFVLERAYRHAQKAVGEGQHEVVIRKATKTRDQEEHYHALIDDIAKQYTHAGRQWHEEDMKRILVDAFKHHTKGDFINYPELQSAWAQMGDLRLVPAIGRDGFVPLGEQTRRFPKKLAAAFITWLYGFGADHRINWSDPKYAREMEMAA